MSDKTNITKKLVAYGLSIAAALSGGFLITQNEGNPTNKDGLHPVYLDAGGVPSVCWGQTGKDLYGRNIQLGAEYTTDECEKMLAGSISEREKQVDSLVKVPYRSIWEKAALISFTYNVGVGTLKYSTLLKTLNQGNHDAACQQLTRFVYANKKKLRGLVSRRGEENQWCLGNVPWDAQEAYKDIISSDIKENIDVSDSGVD